MTTFCAGAGIAYGVGDHGKQLGAGAGMSAGWLSGSEGRGDAWGNRSGGGSSAGNGWIHVSGGRGHAIAGGMFMDNAGWGWGRARGTSSWIFSERDAVHSEQQLRARLRGLREVAGGK
jgi:hypothetical protein